MLNCLLCPAVSVGSPTKTPIRTFSVPPPATWPSPLTPVAQHGMRWPPLEHLWANTLHPGLVLVSFSGCDDFPTPYPIWTFWEHRARFIFLLTSLYSSRGSLGPLHIGGNSRRLLSMWTYHVGPLGHLWCVVINQRKENQDILTKDNSNKTDLGIPVRRDSSLHRHVEIRANNSLLSFGMLLLI